MPEEPSSLGAIDRFLAACVRSHLRAEPFPVFPSSLAAAGDDIADRAAFHGIALLLWTVKPGLAGWPDELREAIASEARTQAFWEETHRSALSDLIGALSAANVPALVTKGTALAYTVYDNPAIRRRGDTDILVPPDCLAAARATLSQSGFHRVGARQSLQETWLKRTHGSFAHEIDLHWRIRGSATISRHLERSGIAKGAAALQALGPDAQGLAPLGNLVVTSLNRADHQLFGYGSGGRKLFEGDRLIWAVDIDLVASRLDAAGWASLVDMVRRSGCAPQLLSGLVFARDSVATAIPDEVIRELSQDRGSSPLQEYLTTRSAYRRMALDLGAARTLSERSSILMRHLFPGEERIRQRFPDADRWPLPLLHARRLVGAVGKSLRRAA